MHKKFEIIEHTADIGIVAHGHDVSELFASAAAGMFSLVLDSETVRTEIDKKIELRAIDQETLLVEWLNELLYEMETEKLVFNKFDIVIKGDRLEAVCRGEKIDFKRHKLRREIKAATYHDLKISKDGNVYQVKIIFDI